MSVLLIFKVGKDNDVFEKSPESKEKNRPGAVGKGGREMSGIEEKVLIDGQEYEVIPVTLSSTSPDDGINIRFLFEALEDRIKAREAISIEREVTEIGEISSYTVMLLKKV